MTEARRFADLPRRLSRLTLVSLAMLGACQLHSDHAAPIADRAPDPGLAASAPAPAAAAARPEPVVMALAPPIPSAAVALDARLRRLGAAFRGEVGLAVRDVATGWTSHYHGLDYFPQQSVSKLWVALSLLDRVDQGALGLDDPITVLPEDITLFHQPIRALALRPGGFRTTNEDLLVRALTQSDNTANDRLLRLVGGPEAVRDTLARKGISGVRFGPGERPLQSQIAGLEWKQDYAAGGGFQAARGTLSDTARQAAFDAYVADPVDGATPFGIVDALARLAGGRLLSPAETERLMGIMSHTHTGPMRLKGGLRPGWTLAHKTGTGQIFQGEQAGYNDVGILTSPEGNSYAVAVLIGRTSRPLPERMALMQAVVRATIDYDTRLAAQREAAAIAE